MDKLNEIKSNFFEQDIPLISFIIPIYNTELYLLETLNCLLVNGYAENKLIEIIIVDDGSKDNSSKIIKNWIEKHNKLLVKFIQQENQGLSAARKKGLSESCGKYIGFCDSDDRIDLNVYIKMAKQAQNNDCDIAICRSEVFEHNTGISYDFYDTNIWDSILENKTLLVTSSFAEPRIFRLEPNANTRLLKREFLISNKIEFPPGLHYEDLPVHIKENALAGKILLLNASGYFYRVNRPGKITDEKSEKRFDILKIANLAFTEINTSILSVEAKIYAVILMIRMVYWCGSETLNNDRKRFYKEACELFSKNITQSFFKTFSLYAEDKEIILLAALINRKYTFLSLFSSNVKGAKIYALGLIFNSTIRKIIFPKLLKKLIIKIKGK